MTGPLVLTPSSTVVVALPALPPVLASPPAVTSAVLVPVAGPRGPRGDPGGGTHEHVQVVPQAVWRVEHHLGRYPAAWSLIDAAGDLCGEYLVEHVDVDTLLVSMDIPTAGTFRLI